MPHHRTALSVALVLGLAALSPAAEYVWIEGENPTGKNFEVKGVGWGNNQYLSKEAWLHVSIEKDNVEKTVPQGGIVIGYSFEAPATGKYEVWNRIGFEFVRSPFSWRIDKGAWQEVPPTELTTDLMDIAVWCEVAWLKMGTADLTKGSHTLEIRLPVTFKEDKDGKKVAERILYASDALCLYKGEFRPNGRFKPDEAWQEETDKTAAGQVFQVQPGASPGERIETPLSGLWQVARFDEQTIDDRTGPIKAQPKAEELYWKGIEVPGHRNVKRPEMIFCHRYFYRTKVKVPAELKGRGFFLHFPSVNMIATVFVNGRQCGWTKAPFAVWDCDITEAVKPGEVNEIGIGIKDTFYAVAKDTRKSFNWPATWLDTMQGMSMQFDMPVWNHRANGILEPPSLVTCGQVYTADVFAIPSVSSKQLGLEITLQNPTSSELTVTVANEIVPVEGGPAELTLPKVEATVPAGKQHVLKTSAGWANPKLWWPDDPRQYCVVTKLLLGNTVIDTRRTKFGFREWTWDSSRFKLNGVPWQGRADLVHHGTRNPDEVVQTWRKNGQTMVRFWGTSWGGMGMQDTLDFHDRTGTPVRRSGIFDGEMASYGLSEEVDADGRKVRRARKDLFDNWRNQLLAQVRGERNHPSVFVWSIENEIVYINSLNLGQAQWVEPAVAEVAKAVMAVDPTRPVMVDGGQALTDQSLPVVGGHYLETDPRDYPDQSYTLDKVYGGKSRNQWPTPKDRPMLLGESYYAAGNPPSWYAGIGGESAFLGRSELGRPIGLFAKMLSEGYRWHGVAGFHFWFAGDTALHYNSWQPVCVLCRQWNWTFGGGTTVQRTLKVFNDTRLADPIETTWQFSLDGKSIAGATMTDQIAPGSTSAEIQLEFPVPPVDRRTPGEFVMTCKRGGKEVFREVKPAWVIPTNAAPKCSLAKADLLVLDPHGSVRKRLAARKIDFTEVARFDDLPDKAKVVLVGKDALTARQATDPKWMSLASSGARVIVLEQPTPLHRLATPTDLEPTLHVGRIAFAENLDHPVFTGLDQPDFFCWSGDHVSYRNVYKKASTGAKSLVQCDMELSCSAVAECPVNEGLLLLCQLVVGEKLDSDAVAQRLFDNLLNYAADYKVVRKSTAVAMDENSPPAKMLAKSGLKHDKAGDVLSAVSDGQHEIVVAAASPANLRALAGGSEKLKAFTDRGGWLVLWGLTPEGLADFNKIVGVNHLLRPFEMERVTLPAVRDPVMSGLTMRDVVMESGEKIMSHIGDRFLANDIFTCVVNFDDIAPFCDIPGPEHWNQAGAKPGYDHWPRNMVNGFVTADSWKYVFSILIGKGEPTKWTMKLPREEEILEFSIALNTIYHKVTKINLLFDDDPKPVTLVTRPINDRQDFPIAPRKAKAITIELADWEKSGSQEVIGVDNLWIRVKRPADFAQKVRPLLNIGALVKYPMGKGGVILNQLQIMPTETVPINAQKKQTIVSTILRNLGATFAGGRTLATGDLRLTPVPFEDQCNQYLTRDRGWFDPQRDLGHLPAGEQKLAGVTFVLRDFRTSPVPSCIMIAGPGVKGTMPKEFRGLKVGRKADALFFLHAFKRTGDWRPSKKDDAPPVVFKYVVHYSDGKSADVPVLYGDGADHWISKDPKGLKSAAVAWAGRFPGDDSGDQAVVYSMPWTNPRPDVEIVTIDLTYDQNVGGRYGVPAWLGLAAATAVK